MNALLEYSLQSDCSIREYQSKVQFAVSIDCSIRESHLKYPPNMLALCWHGTPPYYAFYYAGIFDAGLRRIKTQSHKV